MRRVGESDRLPSGGQLPHHCGRRHVPNHRRLRTHLHRRQQVHAHPRDGRHLRQRLRNCDGLLLHATLKRWLRQPVVLQRRLRAGSVLLQRRVGRDLRRAGRTDLPDRTAGERPLRLRASACRRQQCLQHPARWHRGSAAVEGMPGNQLHPRRLVPVDRRYDRAGRTRDLRFMVRHRACGLLGYVHGSGAGDVQRRRRTLRRHQRQPGHVRCGVRHAVPHPRRTGDVDRRRDAAHRDPPRRLVRRMPCRLRWRRAGRRVDLSLLLTAWGTPARDVDGDGTTGASDLSLVLAAWGACP